MRSIVLIAAAASAFVAYGGDAAFSSPLYSTVTLQGPIAPAPLPVPGPAPIAPGASVPGTTVTTTTVTSPTAIQGPLNCSISSVPYLRVKEGWRPRLLGGYRYVFRAKQRQGLVEYCAVPQNYVLPAQSGWYEEQHILTPEFWPGPL